MFERSEALLKILCAGLGALVLWQAVHAVQRSNPLAGASIPALPSLPGSTNAQAEAKAPPSPPGGGVLGTNAPPGAGRPYDSVTHTNTGRPPVAAGKAGTNIVASGTNAAGRLHTARVAATNATAIAAAAAPHAVTGAVQRAVAMAGHTNLLAQATNDSASPPGHKANAGRGGRAGGGPEMMMAGGPGMPGQNPPLPPAVQARLDRIIQSELLAPVMHPQPVALLGIIGNDALLQAPNGQSGLVKEGGELGGIKLLKLGINRALIEEAGEQKELTLFSGLGSESLLSKPTNRPQ